MHPNLEFWGQKPIFSGEGSSPPPHRQFSPLHHTPPHLRRLVPSLNLVHTCDKVEFNTVDFVESRLLPKPATKSTVAVYVQLCCRCGRLCCQCVRGQSNTVDFQQSWPCWIQLCRECVKILNWPLLLMTCCFKSDELTNYNYIERLVTRSLYTVSDCVMFQRVTLCILYTTS